MKEFKCANKSKLKFRGLFVLINGMHSTKHEKHSRTCIWNFTVVSNAHTRTRRHTSTYCIRSTTHTNTNKIYLFPMALAYQAISCQSKNYIIWWCLIVPSTTSRDLEVLVICLVQYNIFKLLEIIIEYTVK